MEIQICGIEEIVKMPKEQRERAINLLAILHLDYIRRYNLKGQNVINEENAIQNFKNKLIKMIEDPDENEILNCALKDGIPVGYGLFRVHGEYGEIIETHSSRPEIYNRIPNSQVFYSPDLTMRMGRRRAILKDGEERLKQKGVKAFFTKIRTTNNNNTDYRFYDEEEYGILPINIKIKTPSGNRNANATKGEIRMEDIIMDDEVKENHEQEDR